MFCELGLRCVCKAPAALLRTPFRADLGAHCRRPGGRVRKRNRWPRAGRDSPFQSTTCRVRRGSPAALSRRRPAAGMMATRRRAIRGDACRRPPRASARHRIGIAGRIRALPLWTGMRRRRPAAPLEDVPPCNGVASRTVGLLALAAAGSARPANSSSRVGGSMTRRWRPCLILAFPAAPGHRGQVLAHRAHRVRLQPHRAPDWRHRWRPDRLPSVRRVAVALQEGLPGQGRRQAGMENFTRPLVAWQTDDGKDTFCMPMASVIHGFLYNKKMFKKLNLQPPKTRPSSSPCSMVKKDGAIARWRWAPPTSGRPQIVFTNIGPNHWRGRRGRKALIDGKARFTDALRGRPRAGGPSGHLPRKARPRRPTATARTSSRLGRAAIYPTGSWDIACTSTRPRSWTWVPSRRRRRPATSAFISDHMDIGLGINKKAGNKDDAEVPGLGGSQSSPICGHQQGHRLLLAVHAPDRGCAIRWPSRWSSGARNAARRSA